MNHHKPLVFLALAASTIVLCSRSAGLAEILNQDRTGAPGSSAPCSACHNSGPFTVQTGITVFDDAMNPVTSYVPGAMYTVEFSVNSDGSPSGFGFQGTAVLDDASNAGTFSDPAANAQLQSVGTRHIVEHNALSATQTFSVAWQAPEVGKGQVSFYAVGVAANGNGGNSGDDGSPSTQFTIQEGAPEVVPGCLYAAATNYNPEANLDDGSCQFPTADSYCGDGTSYNPDTGQCEVESLGCVADLDNSGDIGAADVLVVLGQFGSTCD